MKCSILEKLTKSELFTVVVIGSRHLKHFLFLKATLQKLWFKMVMITLLDARDIVSHLWDWIIPHRWTFFLSTTKGTKKAKWCFRIPLIPSHTEKILWLSYDYEITKDNLFVILFLLSSAFLLEMLSQLCVRSVWQHSGELLLTQSDDTPSV